MCTKTIRIEVMTDILAEVEVKLSKEQVVSIVSDFMHHISMEQEMESYAHVGASVQKCDKCAGKEQRIKDLENEVKCYNNSVKRRRNAERVWIGNDGEVRFE